MARSLRSRQEKRFGAGASRRDRETGSQTGEVQALVGGRYAAPRLNRALDARALVSLVEPAIYSRLWRPVAYTLVTPIDDGPFFWKSREP